jgi:DNA-binding HxlR family transcriptional regulator
VLLNPKRQPMDQDGTLSARPQPRPGNVVRGSTTGRPLMAALDLFGRRWALRVMWELRDGPIGARALLSRCEGLSSSVLYQRLRELTDAALVTQVANDEYQLTELGGELGASLQPLDEWARRWSRSLDQLETFSRGTTPDP